MKPINILYIALLVLTPLLFTSCELIGDIFRAGIWVGVIGVVLFVGLVLWLIAKVFK